MGKSKKTEFSVTIGYKAVIIISVKAETAEAAKLKALYIVKEHGIYTKSAILDEAYGADGIVNMDKTWKMLYG